MAVALVSLKLITTYLGTEGTGEYTTILTITNFSIVIADLGLFSVSVREIAKTPEREKQILGTVFVIRLVTAAIAAAVVAGGIFLTSFEPHVKVGAAIATGYIFFNLLGSFYDIILQYRLKMQFSAAAELVSKVVSLLALALIVRYDLGFYAIISTVSLGGVIIWLTKWYWGARVSPTKPSFDASLSRWILRTSVPLGVIFIVNNLYFKIDSILLFTMQGAAAAGIYAVAYKVLEVTIFIGSYFSSSLKTTLARNIESNPDSVRTTISRGLSILLFCAVPISVVSVAFAPQIVTFLSDASFVSGGSALIILSLALPLIYCDTLLGEVLVAKGANKLLVRISIVMLVLNVAANLVLIPRYSISGAAFATLFTEFSLLLINLYYVNRLVGVQLAWGTLSKILLAGSASFAAAYLLKSTGIHFLLSSTIAVGLYMLTANVLGVISKNQLRTVLKSA